MKRIILAILLLTIPSMCFAFGGKMTGQTVASSGTPSGTTLVGSDSNYSSGTNRVLNGGTIYSHVDKDSGETAAAGGTLAKGYAYISSWWDCASGDYVKMAVYKNSDGSLVGSSASVECTGSTDPVEFTFSSGVIVSGTAYDLTVIADDAIAMKTNGDADVVGLDDSGTVSSPPSPSSLEDSVWTGKLGGMYVTN